MSRAAASPARPRVAAALLALSAWVPLLSGCIDGDGKARAATVAAAPSPVRAVARGVVEVQGGLLELAAPQDGVVESVAVQEGATVAKGQPLIQLASEQLRSDIAMAQAELKLAQARQQAQAAKLPGARQQAQRLREAARLEAVDAQRADEAQQALHDLEAAQNVAEAETALAAQKLRLAESATRRLTVVSPLDASVVRLQTLPGARVSAQGGRPLLVLLPRQALRVRAEVNESFVARISVGMKAHVQVDAESAGAAGAPLPGARVTRISPVFGSGRLDDEAHARGSVRVVDCTLEFDQPPPLRVGQAVRVEFLQ